MMEPITRNEHYLANIAGDDVPVPEPITREEYYLKRICDNTVDQESVIKTETDSWLEENISQETGYVLDRTLSLENAAAPADLVGELKGDLNDPVTGLQSKAPVITETASGAIASFADGADGMPVKSLVCQITPVQDLHGQDAPYPAGGGKNKLNNTAETTTNNGVTFTVNADGSVSCSGTATDTAVFRISQSFDYAESMILNGCPSGGSYGSGYSMMACNSNGSAVTGQTGTSCDIGSGVTIPSEYISSITQIQIIVRSGVNMNGKEFYPMLRFASVADGTYAPYKNICPISGWTGLSLTRDGANLFDMNSLNSDTTNVQKTISGNTITLTMLTTAKNRSLVSRIPAKQFIGKSITMSGKQTITGSNPSYAIIRTETNGTVANLVNSGGASPFSITGVVPNCDYIIVFLGLSGNGTGTQVGDSAVYTDIQLEIGSTASPYQQYQGETIPISWQTEAGTVYGGYINPITGVLTAGRVIVESPVANAVSTASTGIATVTIYASQIPGSAGATSTLLCNRYKQVSSVIQPGDTGIRITGSNAYIYDNAFAGKTTAEATEMLSGLQIVYDLATPQTYQLDPVTVSTLLGENNIFADCGDVEVSYPCDTKLYIDRPTEPAEDDMIADTLIASGKYFFVNNRLFLSTASIAVGAMIIPGSNCTETSIAEALNTLNS